MIEDNLIKLMGTYSELRALVCLYPEYSQKDNLGYLYCFSTITEPSRIKLGQTKNLGRRLGEHQHNTKIYSGSEIGRFLVTVPLSNPANKEQRVNRAFGQFFPKLSDEWFEASICDCVTALQSLDLEKIEGNAADLSLIDVDKTIRDTVTGWCERHQRKD